MLLCPICAAELIPGVPTCTVCGAPVVQVAPPPAPIAPVVEPAAPGWAGDWPGAVRSALLAVLAGYVLAGAIAVLLAPPDTGGILLWVTLPAGLLAAALGGHWQATEPGEYGYQVHGFPLLLTAAIVLVLARAVHGRFETQRENASVARRLMQALRTGLVLGLVGLLLALLSRYPTSYGLVLHGGYVAAPVGGLVIGLAVSGLTALRYDLTQLPPALAARWTEAREPLRAARLVLVVAAAVGTLGVLAAVQTAPAGGFIGGAEDRRLLAGLAMSAAPNIGWWLLASCLGMPVRMDLLAGDRFLTLPTAWWWPGATLAVVVLVAAATRMCSPASPASPVRRLLLWTAVLTVLGLGFAAFGRATFGGGIEGGDTDYVVGGSLPWSVLLPPVWAALAGTAGLLLSRLIRPARPAQAGEPNRAT